MVEYCLQEGAVAVANHITNKTALHLACEHGHTDVVVAILNRLPALLMIDDSAGETSLHIAARGGHVGIVRNLLLIAEQTEKLKSSDCVAEGEVVEESQAYLYDQANNKFEMNEALPEIEVDIMAENSSDHKTALHEAATSGSTEVLKLLIEFLKKYPSSPRLSRGASVDTKPHGSTRQGRLQSNLDEHHYSNSHASRKVTEMVPGIDTTTLKGRTPFHEAARNNHYEAMEVLLQAGADINSFMTMDLDPTVNSDLTALVQACLMNKPDTVRFLLRQGAKDARLKALSRSLKASLHDIAGILLCYNGHVREVADDVRRVLALSKDASMVFFQVMWNSKKLRTIQGAWLGTVVTELPQYQGRTCAIAQLDISSNTLTELPLEIFKLPYLNSLDISRNEIKSLPYEEGTPNGGWKCLKLAILEAGTNQLTHLPPCLFHLKELKEINACSNRISNVPALVWSAPKLTKLYLAQNQLETFPSPPRVAGEVDDAFWSSSDSPSHLTLSSTISPSELAAVSDSGYRSDAGQSLGVATDTLGPTSSPTKGILKDRKLSTTVDMFQYPYIPRSNKHTLSSSSNSSRKTYTIHTQAVISRRLASFHDGSMEEVEDLDNIEEPELGEKENQAFMLEVLDLSKNKLTSVPANLCCLTPKLTKLNLSKNRIKSLGHINDFPIDLEFLDVSSNDLDAAIAPAMHLADYRYHQPCGKKKFSSSYSPTHGDSPGSSSGMENSVSASTPSSATPVTPPYQKICSHRTHKNLRKLSTLKLNNNQLIDVQLFRSVTKKNKGTGDFTTSMEEISKPRSSTTAESFAATSTPTAVKFENLSKSINFISKANALTASASKKTLFESATVSTGNVRKTTGSDEGSQEGAGSRGEGPASPASSVVTTPLYPNLATLELSHNKLKSVPSNVFLISTLSSLLVSHNPDIDTLPLELSNLEHLWNLEYEGCPLTNPPKEDLDKFRMASDKLLYMRSLLHE